jgi:hypothetical protein
MLGDLIRRESLLPDPIAGLDTILADAATYTFINAPLTPEQIKTLIQPPVRRAD